MLDFAQRYAASIDWRDLDAAKEVLEHTNAFVTPDLAREKDLRLLMP